MNKCVTPSMSNNAVLFKILSPNKNAALSTNNNVTLSMNKFVTLSMNKFATLSMILSTNNNAALYKKRNVRSNT